MSKNNTGIKKTQLLKAIQSNDLSKYEFYYYHWVFSILKKHHFIWFKGDDMDLYSSDVVVYLGFKGIGASEDEYVKYGFEALMSE